MKILPLPSSGACKSGNDWKMVYDVGKRGVMLAHVYKGKIKTAPKGFPQAPEGWFLSEKLMDIEQYGMEKILER